MKINFLECADLSALWKAATSRRTPKKASSALSAKRKDDPTDKCFAIAEAWRTRCRAPGIKLRAPPPQPNTDNHPKTTQLRSTTESDASQINSGQFKSGRKTRARRSTGTDQGQRRRSSDSDRGLRSLWPPRSGGRTERFSHSREWCAGSPRVCQDGCECSVDVYKSSDEDWPTWMTRQLVPLGTKCL